MEQLNHYLQELVSTSSYELHLEPNKNPYIVNASGISDLAQTPMIGTQISMMIFPLIPADVKGDLPNQPTVRFVHPHALGKFSFAVQKTPAGFSVTVTPFIGEPTPSEPVKEVTEPAPVFSQPEIVADVPYVPVESSPASPMIEIESSSFSREAAPLYEIPDVQLSSLEAEPVAYEPAPTESILSEVISANDPQFQTVFSDTSDYEPPGRRDDFDFKADAPVEPIETQLFPQPVSTPVVDRRAGDRRQHNAMAAGRMDALFRLMADFGSSDLHLSVPMPPMVRKDGKMQRLECNEGELTPESMKELLLSIMPEKNQEEFDRRHDTDFAYEIADLARFRCNVFMDRKGMGGVFRIIPSEILTAEKLGLSKAIMDLCSLSKGLVVVTGPTGSGKSTTLCAMVDSINKTREDHIITIEDPIEFVHDNHRCLVNQREVHNHTDSFKDALRAALREDPDILLVGEMRDLETISIAIETAETGHLVFGTLHTTTAQIGRAHV